MGIGRADVIAWFDELQRVYAANKDRLTDLDSAIGDADHGFNIDRGFTAVQTELVKADPSSSTAAVLKIVAATLIRTVGGASGALYGTFFLRAGGVCPEKAELDSTDVAALFRAGVEGIVQRGKAVLEDKTMADALLPALDAMNPDAKIGAMMRLAADAAEDGMLATIPMQARKGRASYLGPRSVGHQDPGATSAYLLIRAAADVWRDR
jgi:dihydroxyacetone kinase-like protein